MNGTIAERKTRWGWWIVAGALLLFVLAVVSPRERRRSDTGGERNARGAMDGAADANERQRNFVPASSSARPATAEDIVASRVAQFGRSRREISYGLARKHQMQVPAEVERFFDAVEAGNWEEIHSLFQSLLARHRAEPPPPEVQAVWSAILDAFGVAEQAHEWPAQKLLDYGNGIMSSLRPGMVYVGGTDPGRWIPALMNTSDGERHVVITQNALADGKYLEYVQFLYGDRIAALSSQDSDAAFSSYMSDARKRLEHDLQFPNEPRQIRPGENVRFSDDQTEDGAKKVQVSGQIAVMDINERLLQRLLYKNPSLSFAMEESFPFKSLNADAVPLGPIMELRAPSEQNGFTPERAAQSVEYWRAQAQELLTDPVFTDSASARKSYSKLVSSQGGLLAQHNFIAEAEEAFRFANELCPDSPEAVFRYVNLLVEQKRTEDAARVANNALRHDPENRQFRDLADQLARARWD